MKVRLSSAALIVVALATRSLVAADPAELLRDARIALRLSSGQLLLIGGEMKPGKNGQISGPLIDKLPVESGYHSIQPGDVIHRIAPDYPRSLFEATPATRWKPGDHWMVYPGAGTSISSTVRDLALVQYCGGIGGYAAAVADLETKNVKDRVLGLRPSSYLAAPSPGLAGVSTDVLTPVNTDFESTLAQRLSQVMLERARKTVESAEWTKGQDGTAPMDRAFLRGDDVRFNLRLSRWQLPAMKPLLFAACVWTDANGAALFAANAVIEEAAQLSVIDFDPRSGRMMRMSEFIASGGWRRDEQGAFLNAWKIGDRLFVLTFARGYEGFAVELMEIVRGKGLVSTNKGFGAGC